MDKSSCRKTAKLIRNLISDKQEKSMHIIDKCYLSDHIQRYTNICIYMSIKDEVETYILAEKLLLIKKQIIVPFIHHNIIYLRAIKSLNELKSGTFGIPEPIIKKQNILPAEIDTYIIPGLAFNRNGHRLGWGKGYYDKLLSHTNGYKIGLCFHDQILPLVPHDSYDIVMNAIITEKETIIV